MPHVCAFRGSRVEAACHSEQSHARHDCAAKCGPVGSVQCPSAVCHCQPEPLSGVTRVRSVWACWLSGFNAQVLGACGNGRVRSSAEILKVLVRSRRQCSSGL